ncbi:MAG: hypothetical protein AAF961_16100, partial [Planctomycetota bacterium]
MAVLLAAVGCAGTRSSATAAETTWTAASGNDWFLETNWTTVVPNGTGDVAVFPTHAIQWPHVPADQEATLGRLVLSAERSLSISGDGGLNFSNPGDAPAEIIVPSSEIRVTATIQPSVSAASGERLHLEVAAGDRLTLSGGFGSGDGRIVKRGFGRLLLNTPSPGWEGALTVEQGLVAIGSADVLGSTEQGTTIDGGTVSIEAPTAEPFALGFGTIETTAHSLRLGGHVTLINESQSRLSGSFVLSGGVSGDGDLILQPTHSAATSIRDVPLSHAGGLTIANYSFNAGLADINIDNSYPGPTEIVHAHVTVRAPLGLGSADAGTTVDRSTLRLHAASPESVSLKESTLAFHGALQPTGEQLVTGSFVLNNSLLTTQGDRATEHYVVQQTISLEGDLNTIATETGALTLAGGVLGSGRLAIEPGHQPVSIGGVLDGDI